MLNAEKTKTVDCINTRPLAVKALALAVAAAVWLSAAAGCAVKETIAETTAAPTTAPATTEPAPPGMMNPLTGLYGMNEEAQGKRPVAVVINNAPDARPQWGLCSPDIVVESLAEGGITRMLWLYADAATIPKKIGSIRSARHDFVEIAEGLDAVFVHWGGSGYAYDALKSRDVDRIDGMYSDKYFFRDNTRSGGREHRGCTTGQKLTAALDELGLRTAIKEQYAAPFAFCEEDNMVAPANACSRVSFAFSQSYRHEFRFVKENKLYYNYLNGNPMVQDGGEQMAVRNLILLYCGVKPLGGGLVDMDLSQGAGIFVSNGGYEDITWAKGGPSDSLALYGADGKALKLNPGKSYIALIPTAQKAKTVFAGEESTTAVY